MRLFLILLIFAPYINLAQSFSGTITDENTNLPLHYATIFNLTSNIGTVTNDSGRFLLQNTVPGDTIVLSFIGYQKEYVVVTSIKDVNYGLKPKYQMLSEVLVLADNDYLYDLISSIRKKFLIKNGIRPQSRSKTAKTYYQLETFLEGQRIELTEAYFNGIYSPYALDDLYLKKGRAGLKSVDSSVMINSETSKAFRNHSLFYNEEGFPENPFCFSKRKLKQKYNLFLAKTFEDNGSKFFVITFDKKNENEVLFAGSVWIDVDREVIARIELQNHHSTVHPFLPYGNINRIDKADLFIAKDFIELDGGTYISSIDFYYNLYCTYHNEVKKEFHTKAFIKAYDHNSEFLLPCFRFGKTIHKDLIDISASLYDSVFWNNAKEFAINVGNQDKTRFIEANSLQIRNMPLRTVAIEHSVFEHMYRQWQPNRLEIGELIPVKKTVFKHVKDMAVFEYSINASIFADLHINNGKATVVLNAVLSPHQTFVDRKMTNNIRAFVNMYFDLIEIEKRNLSNTLKGIQQLENNKFVELYSSSMNHMNAMLSKFSKDVFHGTNKAGMVKWNKYIYDILGVDNIQHFNLFDEELSTQMFD